MISYYDALETRSARGARTRSFARSAGSPAQRHSCAGLCRTSKGRRSRRHHQPRGAGALPVLRKSDLPALHKAAPPFGGFRRGNSGIIRTAVYVARPDLRARADAQRSLARRAGAVCRRLSPRRRGAEHLQLSHDARRFHLRRLGARARLRGDTRGSWQYRTAIRADRSLPPDRLYRHAGFSENPARRS